MTDRAWTALAFADVSRAALERGLTEEGVDCKTSIHVTATGSLARAMRSQGWHAISIKDLTDMVIWSGMPAEFEVPVAALPPLLADLGAFETARKRWRRRLRGRNIALAEDAGKALRRFLDNYGDRDAARVLRSSTADLLLSIRSLASAGLRPDQLTETAGRPLVEAALAAWAHLEEVQPHLFQAREELWFPSDPTKTRVGAVLASLAGRPDIVLVYHGFYFFTPPQWAWFTLVKVHGEAHQYFIVHDDGENRVFEVWRRFFDGRWGMPPCPSGAASTPSPLGDRLREALEGRKVDAVGADGAGLTFTLSAYRDVAEFASDARREREVAAQAKVGAAIYAASAKEIDRVARRFGLAPATSVDLADTALGQFLLALHSCVSADADGGIRLVLASDRLVDMAASGCLDGSSEDDRPSHHVAAIRRALPFFEGLVDLEDWLDRAVTLQHLIGSVVSTHGLRADSSGDLRRMRAAAANPLLLAPWCDLSDLEVATLRYAIARIQALLKLLRIEEPERERSVNEYLRDLRRELSGALKHLPRATRDAIAAGRRQQSLTGSRPLDIEGIIGVVNMHLSRELQSPIDEEADDEDAAVEELRNLDALAFTPASGLVHITNLVDTAFPSRTSAIGWPFDRSLLDDSDIPRESREISQAREDASGLGDLYLFWLALHGVEAGELHLSSIAVFASELRNPSPVLMLMAELDAGRRGGHARRLAGGFELAIGTERQHAAIVAAQTIPPWNKPRSSAQIQHAVNRVHPVARASAKACPRRFALQWALGLSHSFPAPFQHKMLFGNVAGSLALEPRFGLTEAEALETARDAWRHLTSGERLSSLRKRRVQPARPWTPPWDSSVEIYPPDWRWTFTLGGTKERVDRTSRAYDAARLENPPSELEVAPSDDGDAVLPSGRLPSGNPDFDLCKMCPVRPICSEAIQVKED